MVLRKIILLICAMAAYMLSLAQSPIMGKREVPVHEMWLFVCTHNPDFDPAIAQAFATVGDRYGLRGDVALCQAIIETGWFTYRGSAVTPQNHNYCGMGVHRNGDTGCTFDSPEQGVTAMVQHLYAYATRDTLPAGEEVLDPRFRFVKRGSATNWEDLSGLWAANSRYGQSILDIYGKLLDFIR